MDRVLESYIISEYQEDWEGTVYLDSPMWRRWQALDERTRTLIVAHLNTQRIFPRTLSADRVVERVTPKDEPVELTDRGNAMRLVREFGGNALYMSQRNKWHHWDGSHWEEDLDERLHREYVPRVIETLRLEAECHSTIDPEAGKRWYRFMLASQNTTRINNMFTEAKRVAGCRRIQPEDIDNAERTRYLFNCRNATIDLVSGEAREQRREDLIARMAPVTYDPDAESELWLETVDTIFEFEPSLKPFIQRVFGSCLAGDISDGKFFFLWGEGQNGKGTLLETLERVLGNDERYGYAQHAEASTFTERKGGISNDLARLKGSRAVVVGEIKDLRSLDIALLKSVTGGDPLTVRRMWEEYFVFYPQFKLFFQGNHKPELGLINKAVERRFVYIPFTAQIPDERVDAKLKDRLGEEGEKPGILNWLVEGCRDWLNPPQGNTRLRIPAYVDRETRDYLDDLDPVGAFLGQCTASSEGNALQHKALHELYEKWRRVCDKKQLSVQALSRIMQDKGYRKTKPHNKVHWSDIGFDEEEKRKVEEEYEYIVKCGDPFLREEEKPRYLRHSTKDYEEVYGY